MTITATARCEWDLLGEITVTPGKGPVTCSADTFYGTQSEAQTWLAMKAPSLTARGWADVRLGDPRPIQPTVHLPIVQEGYIPRSYGSTGEAWEDERG